MNPLSMSPVRGFHHNHCAHSPLRCPSGRRPSSSWPSPRPSSPSAAPCPSKASSPRSSLSRFLGIGLGFPASVSDLGYFHYDARSINSYGSSSNVQESGFIDSMERKRETPPSTPSPPPACPPAPPGRLQTPSVAAAEVFLLPPLPSMIVFWRDDTGQAGGCACGGCHAAARLPKGTQCIKGVKIGRANC